MNIQPRQTLLLQDQDSSIKSSAIKLQGRLTTQNTHTKSLCHDEIISEKCQDDSFDNGELYDEESSLPLCMKEYYINEKEVRCTPSQRAMQIAYDQTQKFKSPQSQVQKIKLIGFENPIPMSENQHFHQTVEQRNKILSVQLQNQRIKNLHFQKMLSILIDQDQIQRQKFQTITNEYHQKIELLKVMQTQNRTLKAKNDEIQKDIIHYKDLIYLANNNYQNLQSKLQETNARVLHLQAERQERQKVYHQKLQNLKQVMKSLMTNLKRNPVQSETHELPQFRIDPKDVFAPENCYSFGDHDNNIRDRKDKIKPEFKPQAYSSLGQHNKLKTTIGTSQKPKKTMSQRPFDKQNLILSEKVEDSFESKNFFSNKTTINKLKSPKNLTVEQNYRKLFMKTLTSSSQKPKTDN